MSNNTNIDVATETTVDTQINTKNETRPEPAYTLIMGDSPIHSVEWVVAVCQQILGMNTLQALQVALTIHNEGKAPVAKGNWDDCILKRDQVRSKGGDEIARSMGIESGTAIPVWIEEA